MNNHVTLNALQVIDDGQVDTTYDWLVWHVGRIEHDWGIVQDREFTTGITYWFEDAQKKFLFEIVWSKYICRSYG